MLNRKRLLLSKIESSYGVDPTPAAGVNAILTRNLDIQTFQGQTLDLDYNQARLGNNKMLYAAPYSSVGFECDAQSSGTAGTAPAVGPLLRACGLVEKINAANVTGTAQAGAASAITLAAGASAVDDFYKYLSIRTTGGTGSGQTRTISGYVGSTKVATVSQAWTTPPDATTTYSIDAQVVYSPVSASFESVAHWFYMDGARHKLLGSRGSVSVNLSRQGIPTLQFQNMLGLRSAPTDQTTNPVPTLTNWKEPLPVNKANTPTLIVHGYSALAESISFDLANNVVYRNVIGGENVYITDRAPSLSVAFEKPTITVKDFDALVLADTAARVQVIHGSVAGSIVEVESDRVQLTNPRYTDSDGIVLMTLDGRIIPSDTGDDEIIIRFK